MIRFEYLTPTGLGVCGVTEVLHRELGGGPNVIMFTELHNNTGMSVTNAFELIAGQWMVGSEYSPCGIIWIEHYPYEEPTFDLVGPTFDLVGLDWFFRAQRWTAKNPSWRRVSREFVCELIPEEDIPYE